MGRPKHLGKERLAKNINAAKRVAGLTDKEIAADADTNRPNVTLWQHGDAENAPSALHVMKMKNRARPVALAIVRTQADELEAAVIERPEVIEDSPEARAGRVVTTLLAVPSALASRRADGVDDPAEVADELDKTRAAVTVLLEHEAFLTKLYARTRRGRR